MNGFLLVFFMVSSCLLPCLVACVYEKKAKRLSEGIEQLKLDLGFVRKQRDVYKDSSDTFRDECNRLRKERTNNEILQEFLGQMDTTDLNDYSPKNLKSAIQTCIDTFGKKNSSKVKEIHYLNDGECEFNLRF